MVASLALALALLLCPACSFRISSNRISDLYMGQTPQGPQGPQDARSDQQRYTDLLQRTGIASVPFLLRAAAPLLAALPLNARPARADVAPFPRRGFQTKSGLKYFDITESTHGPTPRYGELVSFFYTCYYRPSSEAPLETVDGTPKDAPFLQKHGNGRLIRGIEESLHTMHVGSKRRIVVPQPLGFASFGLGPLPVDPFRRRRLGDLIDLLDLNKGELIYDIELVAIRSDENDQGYYEDIPVSQDEVRKLVIKSLKQPDDVELNGVMKQTTPKNLFKGM